MQFPDSTPLGPGASPEAAHRKSRLIEYIAQSVRNSTPLGLLFAAPVVLGAPVLFLWLILKINFGANPAVEFWLRILVYEPLLVLLAFLVAASFVPHQRTTEWLVGAVYRARHLIVGLFLFFIGFLVWLFSYGAYTLYRLNNR